MTKRLICINSAMMLAVLLCLAPRANADAKSQKTCLKAIEKAHKQDSKDIAKAYQNCTKVIKTGKPGTGCNFITLANSLSTAAETLRTSIHVCSQDDLDALYPCTGGICTAAGSAAADAAKSKLPATCFDSTENRDQLSERELANCSTKANSAAAGTALATKSKCVAHPVTYSKTTSFPDLQGASVFLGQPGVGLSGTATICAVPAKKSKPPKTLAKRPIFTKDTHLDGLVLPGLVVCVTNPGVGVGEQDCDADSATTVLPNVCTLQDHNTTPGDPGNTWNSTTKVCNNSGAPPYDTICSSDADCGGGKCVLAGYGAPDDASCSAQDATGARACKEADSDGTAGPSDGDGTTSKFTTSGCNTNGAAHHYGVCNSPVYASIKGLACNGGTRDGVACCRDTDCWGADADVGTSTCSKQVGSAAGNSVLISTTEFDLKIPGNGECGPDGICCNADDATLGTIGAPTAVFLTSAMGETGMADANNQALRLWLDSGDCPGGRGKDPVDRGAEWYLQGAGQWAFSLLQCD